MDGIIKMESLYMKICIKSVCVCVCVVSADTVLNCLKYLLLMQIYIEKRN